MALWQNDIPLLEYDEDSGAVINPRQLGPDVQLPDKAVLAFLGRKVDDYAAGHSCAQIAAFSMINQKIPVYLHKSSDIHACFCAAPVGAAASVLLLDWLLAHGVRQVIATGSCGVLEEMAENCFLLPRQALRDEGTSYHYLPPARFVGLDEQVVAALARTLQRYGLAYRHCISWTTDGFFRETAAKVAGRRAEGCAVVEMECAALAACAQLRGASFGQLLFTADTLADVHSYDVRGWGRDSMGLALELCLAALAEL